MATKRSDARPHVHVDAHHGHDHDHDHHHHQGGESSSLVIFSASGVVRAAGPVRLARQRLKALGFEAEIDEGALKKSQRFAGDDESRLDALHRVARTAPGIAMATRGGYGITRLLDRIDWQLVAQSVEKGTRWIGHSDFTAFELALLAHAKAPSWAGPMAVSDFGTDEVDEVTKDVFREAMTGELEAVGFRTEAGFDGLQARGLLWGGNLAMLMSLLGTPHCPKVRNGVLFLEDVNEHPYRIERSLLQLHQAGILDAQNAIVLGAFTEYRKSPLDRGYSLKTVVEHLRSLTTTPILTGLPFGHVPTKLSLPVGRRVTLLVDGRDVLIGW